MAARPRKHFTATEKVMILRRHLLEQVPVSNLCQDHQLKPTLFYRWQKQLFENGSAAFASKSTSEDQPLKARIAALEAKLARKNEVLAELAEEFFRLKQNLS